MGFKQFLTEASGGNAYIWKKGDQWMLVRPEANSNKSTQMTSSIDGHLESDVVPKTLEEIEALSDGFYTCTMTTNRFKHSISNVKKSDPKKELAKIEKAEQKTKSAFSDMEAGSRGNAGKSFQGMVRGAQETVARKRQEKKDWLGWLDKAKKISDVVVYDKRNTNWDTKYRHDLLKSFDIK